MFRSTLSRCSLAFAVVLSAAFAGPAMALDKPAVYEQMRVLGQQIRELKPQAGAAAASALASALDQYAALSAQLGGDDPAALLGDGGPAAPSSPGAAPTPPPGCTTSSTSGANNTPVAIPDSGGPVATSTINIAGAGTFLSDVDLTVAITHTFPGDLDFTLTSPAGTVVTISTDNGGSNDDVWNGTTFDDDANPGGQVPYVNNNGLVGDHLYAVGVLATPLAPEEALAAFIGENPNGTWTVTIDDDATGDVGTLASWSLALTTLNGTVITTVVPVASNNTPVAIPDSGGPVATSTINVAGADTYLWDVDLTTAIAHTFPGDLDFTLTSPAGTIVTISTDNGGSNDNVWNGTTFDDDANPGGQVPYVNNNGMVGDHLYAVGVLATPLAPEEALAAFIGEDPNGTWTVTIDDDATGDVGTLHSWSVELETATCVAPCQLTCPANITVNNEVDFCGATVTYPAPVVNGACGAVTCVAASGSFFAVGTTNVTCTASAGPSCSFDITVNDTQLPALTCPADIVDDLPPGVLSGPVNFPPPAVSDNCPNVGSPSCIPPSGSIFPGDQTTAVNCDVQDEAGNSNTCAFNVTLNLASASILEIPAVSGWGLAALALLLVGAALLVLRSRG